jgi:hypothetical protein
MEESEKLVNYFAYASNLNSRQMRERVGYWNESITGYIMNYALRYSKPGVDGTGKANIVRTFGSVVHGVCYELEDTKYEELKKYEPGYTEIDVEFWVEGRSVPAKTLICPENVHGLAPSETYLRTIIEGAKENSLPADYIDQTLLLGW